MTEVSLSQMETIFSLAAHYYSLTSMLPVRVDIDIDSTGLIANRRTYQLNRKGYFSKRRGEKGYQLSMCIAGLTGNVLSHSFMPGNHSALLILLTLYMEQLKSKSWVLSTDWALSGPMPVMRVRKSGLFD